MIEERRYLHRAQFVIPLLDSGSLPQVVADGAVLTEDGKINSVGTYQDLQNSDAVLVDHGKAVLMPGMVNCHTHLELSHYQELGSNGKTVYSGDMTLWIRDLLAARENPVDPEEMNMAAWQSLARLYAGGCRGVADIGNLPESSTLGKNFKINTTFFHEILGLTSESVNVVKSLLQQLPDSTRLAVHSPYSTHPEIIRMIKERASRLGHILPIHVAESSGEVEFLQTGGGSFRGFLEERGVWNPAFIIPNKTPIGYLDALGVLDEQTLCVHCVHVSDEDIEIMAQRNVAICLCPGSNQFLGVGAAPAAKFLARNFRVVIGTDSPASNPDISLWKEMQTLSESSPDIEPLQIIRMATTNGATLLDLDDTVGSLKPGRSSSFLAITGALPDQPEKVGRWLVGEGLSIVTEWVE